MPSSTVSRRMALPQVVRAIVERLEDIAIKFIVPTEDQSWHVYTVTSAEYAALFSYLRQHGHEELYDCMCSLNYDWMSYGSLLALRVPTLTHTLFARSVQCLLTQSLNAIAAAAPENWFVANAICYNAERDALEDTTVGDHHPDLSFYFERDPSADRSGPKRTRTSRDPTVVIEICSADKMRDMEALAEHYVREGDGATRTVVGIDVTRGTYCVWRYLRFLPTRVDGREYRRCFCTERDVRWRQPDDMAPLGGLVFTVRDFLPTRLPQIVEGPEEEEMEALMKRTVRIPYSQMCAAWRLATPAPRRDESDEEGSAEMMLSDTEDDEETGAMATPGYSDEGETEDDEDEWEDWEEDEDDEGEGEAEGTE